MDDDYGFKFKIGELVTLKIGCEECKRAAENGEARTPYSGMVVERVLQQCPGGIQRHYAVTCGGEKPVRANEIELVSWGDYDAAAVFARSQEVSNAARKARRVAEMGAYQEASEKADKPAQ